MEDYAFNAYAENPDAIMVRSANMHDMDIPESVMCVSRAGAGVNNIPLDKLAERGVVVFNAPGANANAVKELTITGMLLASRKVVDGVEWCKTLSGKGAEVEKLVEKGKGQFTGPELQGKMLGVIGLGAIGVLVAMRAWPWGWTCWALTPTFPWSTPGSCPAPCGTALLWTKCSKTAIISPCMCRFWRPQGA